MSPPARVFHLITELDTGGAQAALYRLLSRLDQNRFSPVVACFYNGDKAFGQQIRGLGIPVVDLSTRQRKWRLDALWRLYRLLRHEHPQLLHTWLYHANIAGRVIGRLAGIPAILSAERNIQLSSPWRDYLNRLTAPLARRITCVSQSVADYAISHIGLPSQKIRVIPNGVDMELYARLPDKTVARPQFDLPRDGLLIGAVGRLHPVKNFDLLIRAFASLIPAFPQASLILIGDGPLRQELTRLAEELGLVQGRDIYFLGDQRAIPILLSTLDIFTLPSRYEGMPNAVLEAMASGLPVLSTASGGTLEIIQDNINGLLVPPGNLPALKEALIRLLSDQDLRLRLGKAARERVQQHFSLENTINLTSHLYEEMLQEVEKKSA